MEIGKSGKVREKSNGKIGKRVKASEKYTGNIGYKKAAPSKGSGGFQYDRLFQANSIIDGPGIGPGLKRRIPIRSSGIKLDAVPIMGQEFSRLE